MPERPPSPIHGRRLEALRACAANPKGLRPGAYPTVMPVLEAMGLVEGRRIPSSNRASRTWHLTEPGREAIRDLETTEFGD